MNRRSFLALGMVQLWLSGAIFALGLLAVLLSGPPVVMMQMALSPLFVVLGVQNVRRG